MCISTKINSVPAPFPQCQPQFYIKKKDKNHLKPPRKVPYNVDDDTQTLSSALWSNERLIRSGAGVRDEISDSVFVFAGGNVIKVSKESASSGLNHPTDHCWQNRVCRSKRVKKKKKKKSALNVIAQERLIEEEKIR
jgi:hypothetical protein